MRCVVCNKRIRLFIHFGARQYQRGVWVCSRKHYKAVKEAVDVELGWVYL